MKKSHNIPLTGASTLSMSRTLTQHIAPDTDRHGTICARGPILFRIFLDN